jgi:oligopeptide transport system ATP-binding protein
VSEPLLQVKDLETHLETREGVLKPVNKVSFHVNRSETVGIVGESGSGKTMTALSIMGLIPSPPGKVVGGQVILEGRDLLRLSGPELRASRSVHMAMVFQDALSALNPTMKIGPQISETMQIQLGLSERAANARTVELLSRVGIPSARQRMDDYPHQFSGGMRQRVMLSMAICCKPKLLIADEPTTALDVTIQAQLLDLIRDLKQEMGMAVLWITHDLGVVAELCDRVIVMYAGRTVEVAPVDDLFQSPRHPYTAALLASVPPLVTDTLDKLKAIKGTPPNLARIPTGCPFHPRCEYATTLCAEAMPLLEPTGTAGHVACWHPLA